MRVLNFALSDTPYGETFIGAALADQLSGAGIESRFVLSPAAEKLVAARGYEYTVMDPAQGRRIRAVIDEVVRGFRPDAIVLSDYLTYWATMSRGFDLNPWFIDNYQLPVLPIDLWQWEDTSFQFDVCGVASERGITRRILDMPAHLRPVPVGQLDPGAAGRGFPYRVLPAEQRPGTPQRDAVRAGLGLSAADRLVLVPVSAWQQPDPDERGLPEIIHRLAERVPSLLATYLCRLPERTHFLFVGTMPRGFRDLPADRTHFEPLCAPARYHALLTAADAVLALAANSLTAVRATLLDIPVLVVGNGFDVADRAAVEALADRGLRLEPEVAGWLAGTVPVEQFRMWPKGFHSFLDPVLAGNPYFDAVAQRELLDGAGIVQDLTELLGGGAVRTRLAENRARYLAAVDALPPAAEVFMAAAHRAGVSGATVAAR